MNNVDLGLMPGCQMPCTFAEILAGTDIIVVVYVEKRKRLVPLLITTATAFLIIGADISTSPYHFSKLPITIVFPCHGSTISVLIFLFL
jgi:hypothetical protein